MLTKPTYNIYYTHYNIYGEHTYMSKITANNAIAADSVILIDENGVNKGVYKTSAALQHAENVGLDLVVVSNNNTPVCKVLDYSKYCYDLKKKEKEAAKKAKNNNIMVKEIRFSPNIAEHDINIKLKQAKRFLDDGNRVKLNIEYSGREIQFISKGYSLMETILSNLGCTTDFVVDKEMVQEGRKLSVTIRNK